MATKSTSIVERVDDLFNNLGNIKDSTVEQFLGSLYESHREAERAVPRSISFVLISWAAFYALQQGLVTEASVGSFKVGDLKYIQLLGPVVVGWFAYTLAASVFAAAMLGTALGRFFKHTFPAAYERDLDRLLGIPNFFHVERMHRQGEDWVHERASDAVNVIQILFGLVGTFVACVHVSWMTWGIAAIHPAWRATLIAVGMVLWLRSVLLWGRIAAY